MIRLSSVVTLACIGIGNSPPLRCAGGGVNVNESKSVKSSRIIGENVFQLASWKTISLTSHPRASSIKALSSIGSFLFHGRLLSGVSGAQKPETIHCCGRGIPFSSQSLIHSYESHVPIEWPRITYGTSSYGGGGVERALLGN